MIKAVYCINWIRGANNSINRLRLNGICLNVPKATLANRTTKLSKFANPLKLAGLVSNITRARSNNSFIFWGAERNLKIEELRIFGTRNYSTKNDFPSLDPNRDERRKKLLMLTYVSGFIGVCLLTAVGVRFYTRFQKKAIGAEEIRLREYGRKPVMVRYRGYVLPNIVKDFNTMHSFDVREDDIWVVSFPKSGTTWIQEIVYLIGNDLDFEKAQETNLDERFPFFEYPFPGFKAISQMSSPRYIKSHLPFSLLPNQIKVKKPKIIYIVRNPKDVVVSFYSFSTKFLAFNAYKGTFEDYCNHFIEGVSFYGPFANHVKEAWEKKDDDNVLFLFYEDLHKDMKGNIRKVAKFLGKALSDKDVESIANHCSFDQMSQNNSVNYSWMVTNGVAKGEAKFYRKGKIGNWREHLSPEVVAKIDDIVATKLEPHGIAFCDTLAEENGEENA